MATDPTPDRPAVTTTRRAVVRTGAKLAYAAPLVAATLSLTAGGAAAISPVGCPSGTVAVGTQCLLETGSGCTRTDPANPTTGGCASGRCNLTGTCIACVNNNQCAFAFGPGYTCSGGICQAPA